MITLSGEQLSIFPSIDGCLPHTDRWNLLREVPVCTERELVASTIVPDDTYWATQKSVVRPEFLKEAGAQGLAMLAILGLKEKDRQRRTVILTRMSNWWWHQSVPAGQPLEVAVFAQPRENRLPTAAEVAIFHDHRLVARGFVEGRFAFRSALSPSPVVSVSSTTDNDWSTGIRYKWHKGKITACYDVPTNPTWSRGHFPGCPVMPGVLLSRLARQLFVKWLLTRLDFREGYAIGLQDKEWIFSRAALPGSRLYISIDPGKRARNSGACRVRIMQLVKDADPTLLVRGQMAWRYASTRNES